jgi:hypothetical protein
VKRRGISLRGRLALRRIAPDIKAEMLAKVPTTPGRYTDDNGHAWELRANGRWYDQRGHSEHPRYNWSLGQWTFTAVDIEPKAADRG